VSGRHSREADRLRRELAELNQRKTELESSAGLYRRLAEELRHGEDLFRSMADTANDAILVLDEQGTIIYINKAGEVLFGQSEEDMTGRRLHETLVPERFRDYSMQSFAAHGGRGIESMLGTVREFQAMRKDGTEFWVEVSISAARSGERTYYITFCRDITRRKLAEEELASYRSHLEELVEERTRELGETTEELRRSESYYSSLIRNAVDMIVILNVDFTLRWGSSSSARITGYSPEDIYGRNILDFVHPDDIQAGKEALEQILNDPSQQSFVVVRFRHKDGSWHYHEAVESNLLDDPAVKGIVLNSRDITDRVALNEELSRSERYFRALIENANDIIAVLNRDGTMGYLSPSLQRISGFTQEERQGQDVFQFFHPDDLPRIAEEFARGLQQSGYTNMVEYRWQHKDGSWHWQEAVATNLLDDPAVHGIVVNARDITDRKLAEKSLQDSEEMYRTLMLTAPDAVSISDLAGNFVYVSPNTLRLHGYDDADELLGTSSLDLMAPEDRAKAAAGLAYVLEEGFMQNAEGTFLRKDGTCFIGELNAALIRDAEGNPSRIVAYTRDITDRKLADQALRESEERYRTLVETSPDSIILSNLDGRIIMVNRSGLDLLGRHDPDELLGTNVIDHLAPEERQRAKGLMRSGMLAGKAVSNEYTLLRQDGTSFLGEITATLVRYAEGNPAGFIAMTRDITDRRRAEERLRKLNECFLSLGPDPLENIRLLALTGKDILAADTVRYGRMEKGDFYVFSSLQAEDGFVHIEEVEDYLCYKLLSRGATGPVTTEDVEEHIFKDDPDTWRHGFASYLFHPIYVQGESVGYFNMLYKHAKTFSQIEVDTMAMLARAIGIEEERYAFNESLRDFVDIASHELRHPVAILSGFTETLDEHGTEMDEPTRKEVIEAIRHATERISHMVMGLINVSLVERERFLIAKRQADLVDLAEHVLREMRIKVPGREFDLKPADKTLECDVDPERFRDLMVILLDNAVKYSAEGTAVEVVLELSSEDVAVSVLDRGIGVPPEHRDKLFNRFYQVEEAQYHSTPGLGLGLFLARQIVESHGGRLWHEPREGGGSVFRFTLPRT
jgi:PAS domain S-box-containing protein